MGRSSFGQCSVLLPIYRFAEPFEKSQLEKEQYACLILFPQISSLQICCKYGSSDKTYGFLRIKGNKFYSKSELDENISLFADDNLELERRMKATLNEGLERSDYEEHTSYH